MSCYEEDLAYVHDTDFHFFAVEAWKKMGPFLKRIPQGALVVDLGCGSGVIARKLVDAGYKVLGVDFSQSLIDLAKMRVPEADFVCASFYDFSIPPCSAVISTSECFNYGDPKHHFESLGKLFERIFHSLKEDGFLMFDLLEPGISEDCKLIYRGEDWDMFVHRTQNPEKRILTREITLFRKIGALYRKSEEMHTAILYPKEVILEMLNRVGFDIQTSEYEKNHIFYVAKKGSLR